MSNATHIALTVACEPHLARIVRMTAANVATLSSMSVERVEDIRMAAEEAFIYACGTAKGGVVVAIAKEMGVPVKFVGLGEGIDDLQPFDPVAFVNALI